MRPPWVWLSAFLALGLLTACAGGSTTTAPSINSFTAEPQTIAAGQSSTLSWSVSGSSPITLSIDNGVGEVSGEASVQVTPAATTTYTLTATNSAGSDSEQVTVTVNALAVTISSPSSDIYTNGMVSVQVAVAGATPDTVELLRDEALLVTLAPPYTYKALT